MADGAARADQVLPDRRDRRPRGVRHRLGRRTRRRRSTRSTASSRSTWTPRGIKGVVGGARLLRQPREDRRDPEARRPTRSGSRTACRGTPQYRKQGVTGITANAIDVVDRDRRLGPVTPVGINLPNDQDDPRAARQQVGVALERQRGLRQVDAAGVPQRVRVDAGGSRARREVEQRSPAS